MVTDEHDTWPPPHLDDRLDELVKAGAQFTPEAVSIYVRQLRDATQAGLDACKHISEQQRLQIEALELRVDTMNEKIMQLALELAAVRRGVKA